MSSLRSTCVGELATTSRYPSPLVQVRVSRSGVGPGLAINTWFALGKSVSQPVSQSVCLSLSLLPSLSDDIQQGKSSELSQGNLSFTIVIC